MEELYQAKHDKVPTLILDDLNKLIGTGEPSPEVVELLNVMHTTAVNWAKESQVTVVFVASTGRVQSYLSGLAALGHFLVSWCSCSQRKSGMGAR